ncbi:hypothetical protein BDR03DRAFT_988237, partial [Suillus americanus]
MEFDIATAEKATAYQRKVDKLVRDLLKKHPWSRIVIGITNHTDNVTGDPFAGYNGEGYIAGAVDNFLAILLKPWQVLIDRADESYLWFFACGALVNNPTSFAALQQSLEHHRLSASIAFTAVRFQPAFTSHLLFAFVEQVLIERFPIRYAFPHMLGQSNKLGRHTDIVLMRRDTPGEGLKIIGQLYASSVQGKNHAAEVRSDRKIARSDLEPTFQEIINMPKNTAKVAKVPKKKVKVGAILSGIARAAPSKVAVGSMVNVSKGPSAPLHIEGAPPVQSVQTSAPNVSTPAITTSSPHKHECVNCGAIVCEQFLPRSSGCIFLRTVEVAEKDFQCPMCSRLGDGKDAPLRRKKVKMAWPMCIINLNLESMKDDYLARTVTLEAQNHYRTFLANLFALTLHMRGGAHVSESKKLAPGAEFIVRNTKAGLPPNTFLILDTHSDEYTGMLQHTGGHT